MALIGQNFPNPVELANSIVQNVKSSAQSIIKSCQSFSLAWENYEAEVWSDAQMSKFLNRLSDAGIGSGPKNLYSEKDGRYRITSKHATLSMLKGIGDSSLFENKVALNACRVLGYSVLYQLTLYYTAAIEKAERTREPRAQMGEEERKTSCDNGTCLRRRITEEDDGSSPSSISLLQDSF